MGLYNYNILIYIPVLVSLGGLTFIEVLFLFPAYCLISNTMNSKTVWVQRTLWKTFWPFQSKQQTSSCVAFERTECRRSLASSDQPVSLRQRYQRPPASFTSIPEKKGFLKKTKCWFCFERKDDNQKSPQWRTSSRTWWTTWSSTRSTSTMGCSSSTTSSALSSACWAPLSASPASSSGTQLGTNIFY